MSATSEGGPNYGSVYCSWARVVGESVAPTDGRGGVGCHKTTAHAHMHTSDVAVADSVFQLVDDVHPNVLVPEGSCEDYRKTYCAASGWTAVVVGGVQHPMTFLAQTTRSGAGIHWNADYKFGMHLNRQA